MDHQSVAEAFWILIIISTVTSSLMCVCEIHLLLSSLLLISLTLSRSQPNHKWTRHSHTSQTLTLQTDSCSRTENCWVPCGHRVQLLFILDCCTMIIFIWHLAIVDFPVLTAIQDAVFMLSSCLGRLEGQGSMSHNLFPFFSIEWRYTAVSDTPLTLAQCFIQMMNYFPDFTNFYHDGWDKRNRKSDDVVVVLQWCSSCVFEACLHYLQKDVLV